MRQLQKGAHQEGLTLRRCHEHPQRLRRSAPPLYRQRGAVTSTVGDSVEHALHVHLVGCEGREDATGR